MHKFLGEKTYKKYRGIESFQYDNWEKFIDQLTTCGENRSVWRGQNHSHDNILPTIYREKYADTLADNELKVFKLFYEQVQGVVPETINMPSVTFDKSTYDKHKSFILPDWVRWWGLAQHFGLPTPFLDWSLHPLITLFFGLASFDVSQWLKKLKTYSASEELEANTGWAVDVWELNQMGNSDDLMEPVINKIWVRQGGGDEFQKKLGAQIHFFRSRGFDNKRIVAQGAILTYFIPPQPDNCTPSHNNYDLKIFFENLFLNQQDIEVEEDFFLKRHTILFKNGWEVIACRRFLSMAGITFSSIFPDLEGIVKDIIFRVSYSDYTSCLVPFTDRDMVNIDAQRHFQRLEWQGKCAEEYAQKKGEF